MRSYRILRPLRGRLPATILISIGCATLLGCGTDVYDQAMAARLQSLKTAAPWADLYAPTRIDGTPVTIRVPQLFKASYRLNTPHVSDNGAIDPNRAQPPFLKLPGFKRVFEGFDAITGRRTPYYCYLAAVPAGGDESSLARDLQAKLKKLFPTTPDAWETVQVNGPGGNDITWQKLRVSGEQFFDFDPGTGGIDTIRVPGTFELWLHEANGYSVLVGWRITDATENKIKLLDLAPLTAATIAFSDAPPEAAPEGAADAPDAG